MNGPKPVVGSIVFSPLHSANTGWECPKCHRIYSPSVKTCECCNPILRDNMQSSETYTGTSNLPQQLNEGN